MYLGNDLQILGVQISQTNEEETIESWERRQGSESPFRNRALGVEQARPSEIYGPSS
jgi:hypothetical protein